MMPIGKRLRERRQEKGLSQNAMERATGLLRCYISRIEHGHGIPSIETLERFATALGVPLYRLFYTGADAPPTPHLTLRPSLEELAAGRGPAAKEARYLQKWEAFSGRLAEPDREIVLGLARRLMARK
jgi:transcriptional regulator with XRE-family HTH domain